MEWGFWYNKHIVTTAILTESEGYLNGSYI